LVNAVESLAVRSQDNSPDSAYFAAKAIGRPEERPMQG